MRRKVESIVLCGALVVMPVLAVALVLMGGLPDRSSSHETKAIAASSSEQTDRISAIRHAQRAIRDRLKSPATAEFPSTRDALNHVSLLGNHRYRITSYVDAQNSFGALIRSAYTATVRVDGARYRVESAELVE